MPGVSCGFYLAFLIACTSAIGIAVVRAMRLAIRSYASHVAPRESLELDWRGLAVLSLAAVVVLIGTILGVIVLNFVLELLEYLAFVRRKCPVCGARRWSWGYTRGFGL